MRINRKITNIIRTIFDDWVPPAIRDSRWFMEIPMRIVFGKNYRFYMDFKKNAYKLGEKEFVQAYEKLDTLLKDRETDLSGATTKLILSATSGNSVLDAGCGKGYLAVKLGKKMGVTALDMAIDKKLKSKYKGEFQNNMNNLNSPHRAAILNNYKRYLGASPKKIKWIKGRIEKLPFADKSFDTVVCAHTLEHVLDIQKAISELRRVTKKRLMIVVPKQRPYRYTFDLHLHFFPNVCSLQLIMGNNINGSCIEIEGDLFYVEERG